MAKETNENLKRFNIRMGNEIFKWYENRAKTIGVPTSAYMVMILAEHSRHVESMAVAKKMPFEEMQELILKGVAQNQNL